MRTKIAAFIWCLLTSIFWLVIPAYVSGITAERKTLLDVNGPRVFILLAIPVVVATAPLFIEKFRAPCAVLLAIFAFLSGASIGLYYWPSVVLLFWPRLQRLWN
jgi:hypothetical protein